jgi:hypothetical protein
MTDPKPRPNQGQYREILRRMTDEEKLLKTFELSEMGRQLFKDGLRARFPEKSEEEILKLYIEWQMERSEEKLRIWENRKNW